MDLAADLTSEFTWNTKQIFAYVTVDYVMPDHPRNSMVVWSAILQQARDADVQPRRLRVAFPYAVTEPPPPRGSAREARERRIRSEARLPSRTLADLPAGQGILSSSLDPASGPDAPPSPLLGAAFNATLRYSVMPIVGVARERAVTFGPFYLPTEEVPYAQGRIVRNA